MRERDVVAAFARWLRTSGWEVSLEVDHVDVVATRGDRRLLAEAKGTTTSPGLDIDTAYGQLLRRMQPDQDTSYAIVVPEHARKAATRVPHHVLSQLDITVFSVDEDGQVRALTGDPPGRHPEHQSSVEGDVDAHPVDRFFEWVESLPQEIYPDELVPIAGRHVDGVAGFPAGRGLYAECGWDHSVPPPFPYRGLMLVGNHLDAEEPYLEKLARGEANGDPCPKAPTMRFWTMLYALLDEAEIPREEIFVTNVHPALIAGTDPRGVISAGDVWLSACRDLLRRQIEVMRPRTVAAMGVPAQRFVSDLFEVEFTDIPGFTTVTADGYALSVAGMRHPSAAQSLDGRRRTAEILRMAISSAGRSAAD